MIVAIVRFRTAPRAFRHVAIAWIRSGSTTFAALIIRSDAVVNAVGSPWLFSCRNRGRRDELLVPGKVRFVPTAPDRASTVDEASTNTPPHAWPAGRSARGAPAGKRGLPS